MSINVMTVSGNLGRDCEVRHTPSGAAIGNFSLPVKQGYGEHEKVSWVECKLIGKRAESLSQYLTKGTKVTVTGEFVYEQWERDGVKHGKPVIVVNSLDFGGSGGQSSQYGNNTPQQNQAAPAGDDPFGDSIPF